MQIFKEKQRRVIRKDLQEEDLKKEMGERRGCGSVQDGFFYEKWQERQVTRANVQTKLEDLPGGWPGNKTLLKQFSNAVKKLRYSSVLQNGGREKISLVLFQFRLKGFFVYICFELGYMKYRQLVKYTCHGLWISFTEFLGSSRISSSSRMRRINGFLFIQSLFSCRTHYSNSGLVNNKQFYLSQSLFSCRTHYSYSGLVNNNGFIFISPCFLAGHQLQ